MASLEARNAAATKEPLRSGCCVPHVLALEHHGGRMFERPARRGWRDIQDFGFKVCNRTTKKGFSLQAVGAFRKGARIFSGGERSGARDAPY